MIVSKGYLKYNHNKVLSNSHSHYPLSGFFGCLSLSSFSLSNFSYTRVSLYVIIPSPPLWRLLRVIDGSMMSMGDGVRGSQLGVSRPNLAQRVSNGLGSNETLVISLIVGTVISYLQSNRLISSELWHVIEQLFYMECEFYGRRYFIFMFCFCVLVLIL